MGIRDTIAQKENAIFGVDTETYNTPSYGLKSIQVYGINTQLYLTVDDWDKPDSDIRYSISKQFVDWLDNLQCNCTLAFFNINYDFSQFAYYLICQSDYVYVDHETRLTRHQIRVLESDRQLYKVELVNANGKHIRMVDIGNFLTSTTLNKACKDWIGKEKVAIESKDFIKQAPTEKEKEYALEDAKLTYELYSELVKVGVIEGRTVTIAGRTIKHFKDYLKSEWGLTFERWAWNTDDPELIEEYSLTAE